LRVGRLARCRPVRSNGGRRTRTGSGWHNAGLGVLAVAAAGLVGAVVVDSNAATPVSAGVTRTSTPTPTSTPIATKAPAPLKVQRPKSGAVQAMFVGDSLTGGYFASDDSKRFRDLVTEAWRKGGDVETREAAIAHADTTKVDSITDVPAGLNVAVVELGTNDVDKTSVADFSSHYGDLLDKVRDASPDTAIVCAGVWQPPALAESYDDVIARECAKREGRFVPLAGIFDESDMRGPAGRPNARGTTDDFHPNDAGHRAIADALLAAVRLS